MELKGLESAVYYLCEKFQPKLIVLYGSAAQGRLRAESDVDIALLCDTPIHFSELLDSSGKLSMFFGRDVDLVDLLEVSPVLCRQVADGKLVFERKPGDWATWLTSTMSRYFDLKTDRKEAEQSLIRRFADGET